MFCRLLPVLLLASCSTIMPTGDEANTGDNEQARMVQTREFSLGSISKIQAGQGSSRRFGIGDTSGSIRDSGDWELRIPVTHTRLHCATYETGLQLGRGDNACTQVRWLTEVQYGSRRTHCNNASLIHSGRGSFEGIGRTYEQSNCVRVVTRCSGPC